jgi:hypothetical protein
MSATRVSLYKFNKSCKSTRQYSSADIRSERAMPNPNAGLMQTIALPHCGRRDLFVRVPAVSASAALLRTDQPAA